MKNLNIILISIALILGGYYIYNSIEIKTDGLINLEKLEKTEPKIKNNKALESQVNEEGQVSVAIAPLNILDEKAEIWNFEIIMNTHSVELGEDMAKVSFLIDDKGNKYLPIAWEGDESGGHHREGILKFKPISPKPIFIKMTIKEVGDVKERNFEWNLDR